MANNRDSSRYFLHIIPWALAGHAYLCAEPAKATDHADGWPQFLGPSRNGISSETGLLEQWPEGGPKELWRVPVASPGVAVRGDLLVTLAKRDDKEWVVALNAKDGSKLWETEIGPAPKQGPWTTPSVASDLIHAVSGDGHLVALRTDKGEMAWRHDIAKDHGVKPGQYGAAHSPLVVDDLVIVNSGTVLAFRKNTGELAWKTGEDIAGHSSPALLNNGGRAQVVASSGVALAGYDLKSGKQLWRYPFQTKWECNVVTPVAHDGHVFIASPGDPGCAMLALKPAGDGFEVTEAWKSPNPDSVMSNYCATAIVMGKHLYGINVVKWGPAGKLACVEAESGKLAWEQEGFGEGNLIAAEGKLWVTTFKGELVLARLKPDGYEELGRKQVVGETRQSPILADGRLYLCDNQQIVCLDVRMK